MQKYSSNAIDLFYNTKYSGATVGADVIVKNENKETGEVVKVYLVVRNNKIKKCSFQAMGSINLFACMSTICELSINKQVSEAESLSEKDVINSLKQINKQEFGIVTYSLESFKKAIKAYRKKKEKGTIQERETKKKEIYPSKDVTIFNTSEISLVENEIMNNSEEVINSNNFDVVSQLNTQEQVEETDNKNTTCQRISTSKTIKSTKKTNKKIEKSTSNIITKEENVSSTHSESLNSELMVKPVGGKTDKKKASKPTKIDVRVVDERNKEPETVSSKITQVITTKTQKTVNGEIIEDSSNTETKVLNGEGKEDNMMDEIDSITEQLTNAISQLNFQFDDKPENESVEELSKTNKKNKKK